MSEEWNLPKTACSEETRVRILFLTQIIPYPPDAGPKIKTWHVLRYLAGQGHQIFLASFVRPDEEAYIAKLWEVCAGVYTVPIRRSRWTDIGYLLRSQVTGRPFLVERDNLPGMRELVRKLLETEGIDCIHADQLTMAQFALQVAAPKPRRAISIFDAHNAVWTIVERMRRASPWYMQPFIHLEAERVKRYEGMLIEMLDHTLAVTEIDRQDLLKAIPAKKPGRTSHASESINTKNAAVTVIPIAVDTVQLQPIQRKAGSLNILTLGTLHYPPNADGIRWFAREVFPLVCQQIPGTKLTIIGKNPPPDFHQLAAQNPQAITITGYVPSLIPYLEQAALVVVPVRAGSGMRVRILEAFAQAMPVVTTSVGLEGITARPGEDVLVADNPHDFAEAVVGILKDPAKQAQLASNGRHLAERLYDWQVVLQKLERVYTMTGKQQTHIREAN